MAGDGIVERVGVNGRALSGRQLAVAAFVAGLSPAAALAGRVSWLWLLVWCAVALALAKPVLRRMEGRRIPGWLRAVYALWGTLLAARVLERAADRLVLTSGGSSQLWLVLLLALPLVWMGWGRTAPFFRTVEVLWLAVMVILALVLGFGLVRLNWRYVLSAGSRWQAGGFAAAELFAPAVFLLPYIYNVETGGDREGRRWLAGLAAVGAGLCAVTSGLLGGASAELELPFFVAAGLLGKTARCEGVLSALWLLPDLTLAGLFCRVWGERRWPALGALLAAALALGGVTARIPTEIFPAGTMVLLLLVLVFSEGNGKIVVRN